MNERTDGGTKRYPGYPASWGIASVPISATSLSLAALEAWSFVQADMLSLHDVWYVMCEYTII